MHTNNSATTNPLSSTAKALVIGLLLCCTNAAVAGEYFLNASQKGSLIIAGKVEQNGQWYNVAIVPGYVYPAQLSKNGWIDAGNHLKEYGSSKIYKDVGGDSKRKLKWVYKDVLTDFTLNGTKKAWLKYFGKASQRVDKRVFGWWLSYPWATLQSVTDSTVRILGGTTTAVVGTATATVLEPAYHLASPTLKAAWNGAVEGVVAPVTFAAWNTVIAPPMALLGQKPSKERTDGFWVYAISGPYDLKLTPEVYKQLVAAAQEINAKLPKKPEDLTAQLKQQEIDALRIQINALLTAKAEYNSQQFKLHQQELDTVVEGYWAQAANNNPIIVKLGEGDYQQHRAKVVKLIEADDAIAKDDKHHYIATLDSLMQQKQNTHKSVSKTEPLHQMLEVIDNVK